MAQFKGTVFISTRIFTEKRFGAEGLERVLAVLDPTDRELLSRVDPMGWIPVEPVLAFHHALDQTHGTGDLALCVEAGRFSAGWALNTILKVFVKLRSPRWLVEKSGSVWGRYHDTGRWEIAPSEPQRLHGKLHEFAVRDEAFCARLRGWLAGAIELTGGRQPQVVERACTLRGHGCHEFVCSHQ